MTSTPLRVLVVEDSEDDTLLLVHELKRSGRDVVWERVETAEQMKGALEGKSWDLVVSDYSLPHFSGPKALELLKETGLDLPFIVVSGTVGEDIAVETMKAGAHDFLLKGNFTRLVPAVIRELEHGAQRRAGRKAEEARAQLGAIVESSGDAIIGRKLDGTVTAWNPGAERLYGYSAEEVLGRAMSLHVPSDRAGELRSYVERIGRGDVVDSFETVRIRKDGTRIDVSLTVSPIRNSSGKILGASTIARDISQRKRAEESIQKLVRAVEQAKNVILMTDPNGAIAYVNPAFEEIYGYSMHEALGKTPRILKSGQHDQAFYVRFWSRLLAGESVREEFVNKTKDGRLVTVEGLVSPVLDAQGQRSGFIAVQEDITERKRSEARILQLNRLLRTISEVNQLIVRTQDREALLSEGCRVLVEHGGFAMVWVGFVDAASHLVVPAARAGIRPEYLDGIAIRSDDTPEGRGPVGTAIRTGRFAVVEDVETDPSAAPWRERMLAFGFRTVAAFPIQSGDSVTGALAVYASKAMEIGDEEMALLDELAHDLGFALNALDNRDERRRAEESLAKRERYFRSLIENAQDIITVIDLEGTIRFQSPAAARILGSPPSEFVGKSAFDFLHPEDAPGVQAALSRAIASPDSTQSAVFRFRHSNGSWKTMEGIGKLIGEDSPQFVVNSRDVTESRAVEEQLRQAQKMEAVGRLAGGIAHDFNNLLTAILGYTELLASKLPADSGLQEEVGEIRQAGERAAGLTKQLLAFSRKQVLQPAVLRLNDLVGNLEKMLRRVIGEDVQLVTRLDPSEGSVRADPGQLEQVIVNLAVNARDAMPSGGTLAIETAGVELDGAYTTGHAVVPPGSYTMLAVSDTGVGMDAGTQARIFEPFFTTKEKGKGTGLGLSTVYGIVKQSGGFVWVYSEPGKGTTFKIYLPTLEEIPAESPPKSVDSLPAIGTETVLIVEDERAIRALSRRVLETRGYRVLEASSGKDALERVLTMEGPVHLLLTDLVMPDMGGSELASRLQELRPDIRVLFMSGYTDDGVVRNGLLGEGRAFLQKPFTPQGLARKVRELLDAPRQEPAV